MKYLVKYWYSVLLIVVLPVTLYAQTQWEEKDDMYFSKKDRAKQMASAAQYSPINSTNDYAANHNFGSPTLPSTTAGSPTVQGTTDANDINNQYFIKDYSLPKKTTYTEIPTNKYSRTPSLRGGPNVNVLFSYGSSFVFGSPGFYGYNPYLDPFSPYYDPFFGSYYSYGYNPWRYGSYNPYGYTYGYGASNSSCTYTTYGTTSYARTVSNDVRYRNGRKVLAGSRASGKGVRSNGIASSTSDRPVKSNGKAIKRGSSYNRSSAVKSTSGSQFNSRTRYSRPSSRTTQRTTNRWNNSSPRNSGHSSSMPSYSSGGTRARSSGARPSTGSSRSTSSRGRGN